MAMRIVVLLLISLLFWKDASAQAKTENVVLITLDGLRWQELFSGADPDVIWNEKYVDDIEATASKFWDKDPRKRRELLFPFMWKTLASQGQIYGNRWLGNKVNVANRYWFSYPGYNELLTGNPDKRIKSNARVNNPNETILEFANQQGNFKGKVAAFASWDVFHYIINGRRSGIHINAGNDTARVRLTSRERYINHLQRITPSPWKSTRYDQFTYHYATEYLKKNSPRLVLIAFGETDEFAHHGHYDSYLQSARNTDQYIEEIWKFIQSDPRYKDKTTLIISTDHGRGSGKRSWKGHGVGKFGSNHTWFAIMGPDTKPLGEIRERAHYYNNQLAKTIAAFLNLNYPVSKSEGHIITTALAD